MFVFRTNPKVADGSRNTCRKTLGNWYARREQWGNRWPKPENKLLLHSSPSISSYGEDGESGVDYDRAYSEHNKQNALHYRAFRDLGRKVTEAVRSDDSAYYDRLARTAGDFDETKDYKALWRQLRGVLPKHRRKGQSQPLMQQQLDDKWHPHFCALEAGHILDQTALANMCEKRQNQVQPAAVDLEDLPVWDWEFTPWSTGQQSFRTRWYSRRIPEMGSTWTSTISAWFVGEVHLLASRATRSQRWHTCASAQVGVGHRCYQFSRHSPIELLHKTVSCMVAPTHHDGPASSQIRPAIGRVRKATSCFRWTYHPHHCENCCSKRYAILCHLCRYFFCLSPCDQRTSLATTRMEIYPLFCSMLNVKPPLLWEQLWSCQVFCIDWKRHHIYSSSCEK